jgi:hypothetical protein
MTKVKWVLIAVALAWALVNAAGLVMAVAEREPIHAGVHLVVAVGLVIGAYMLKRTIRPKPSAQVSAGPSPHVLTDEIDRLQRELDEAQRGRDFAEQLLKKRADPPDR